METIADYQLSLVRHFLEASETDFLGSSEVRVLRLMVGLSANREVAAPGQLRAIDGGREDGEPAA